MGGSRRREKHEELMEKRGMYYNFYKMQYKEEQIS
jgi:ABC-type multidrug transport system fused ATPase/permease subunit